MPDIEVLHVIARMNVGGTARYLEELVGGTPRSALATGYVQGSEIEDPSVLGLQVIRIHHLGRKISLVNDFKAWRELSKIIRDTRPRIVHTHTFKAGLIGRLIRGSHKRVHTFHGHLFEDDSFSRFQKTMILFVEKFLSKRTDILISVGEKVGLDLRKLGIGGERTWISIAPGVRPFSLINKIEARKLIHVADHGILIGWLARMTNVKNPELFLEVAKRFPDYQFVMAGGGDLFDLIKKSASKNVKLIGWAEAAIFWAAVDISISTSRNEGMPVALIEAQLAGVPVVATDVGSVREVIADGVTGFITEISVNEISLRLMRLIESDSLREEFAANAQLRSSGCFNVENMIHAHNSIYNLLK
jgi:glycosyltransferase involved in cell wall biosynthesis